VDSPFVELDCFGTDCAARDCGHNDEFCRLIWQQAPWYLFYGSSVGDPWLRLEDGRDVVIKFRPPEETNPYLSFDRTSLESICRVMKWLTDRGYPCPKPILVLLLWQRAWRQSKSSGPGSARQWFQCRLPKSNCFRFCRIVRLLRSLRRGLLLKALPGDKSLYAQPHSKLFDFEKHAPVQSGLTRSHNERVRPKPRGKQRSHTRIGELSTTLSGRTNRCHL